MALKIFDPEQIEAQQKARASFADDVVGRFRSGYQIDGRPASLQTWRVTTGDPEVADAIKALLGGDDPQEWDAAGEDNLEVFTSAEVVHVIVDGPSALRQKMVLRNRNGQVIRSGDGQVLDDGTPDPQAGQSFAERKEAARSGIGAVPETSLTFRLKANPDLGLFRFQSSSWSLVSDIAYFGIEDALTDIAEDSDGQAKAHMTIGLEEVSFIAKSGPSKGKKVSYTKPVFKVVGPAK